MKYSHLNSLNDVWYNCSILCINGQCILSIFKFSSLLRVQQISYLQHNPFVNVNSVLCYQNVVPWENLVRICMSWTSWEWKLAEYLLQLAYFWKKLIWEWQNSKRMTEEVEISCNFCKDSILTSLGYLLVSQWSC